MCHTDSQCYINSITIYRLIHINGSATTAKKAVITHFCCFQAAGWVVFEGCQFSFDAAASVDNSMSDDGNPCLSCGACCAFFRVSFYWAEADDGAGRVPAALTEPLTPFLRCMSGTNDRVVRCRALQGHVGEHVSCSIYACRPSPCQAFQMSGEDGRANAACDRARAHFGLPLPPSTTRGIVVPPSPSNDALGCQAVD